MTSELRIDVQPAVITGAGGGLGKTKGFYNPGLSIEDVRDHLDEIRGEAGYTVPGGPTDEMSELFATVMANHPDLSS